MKDKAGHLIWATLPTLRGVGHQCWATFPRCRAGLGTIVGHLPTLNEVTGMSINSWVGHQCWATFHLPRIAPRCSMTGRAPLKGHISPALIKVQWGWGVGHLEGPHCPCCSRSQIVEGVGHLEGPHCPCCSGSQIVGFVDILQTGWSNSDGYEELHQRCSITLVTE